jgi:hypothetical protein
MKKFITLLLVFLSITGCAVRIEHPEIPLAEKEALHSSSLPANKGRVVFYLGKMFGVKMNRAADIYINEIKLGTIGNREEMVVVDLPPDNYFFKWNVPQEDMDYSHTQPAILKIPVQGGQTTYLEANFIDKTSAAAYLFGAFAGAFAKFATVFDQDTMASGQQALDSHRVVLYERNFCEQNIIATPNITENSLEATTNINHLGNQQSSVQTKTKQSNNDTYLRLEKLKNMYENKLITKEEYDSKRKELVNEF